MATGRKSGSAAGSGRTGGSAKQGAGRRAKKTGSTSDPVIIPPPEAEAGTTAAAKKAAAKVIEGKATDVTPPEKGAEKPDTPPGASRAKGAAPKNPTGKGRKTPAGSPADTPRADTPKDTPRADPAPAPPSPSGTGRGGWIAAVLAAGLLGGGAGYLAAVLLNPPPPDRAPEIAALSDRQKVQEARLEQALKTLDTRLGEIEQRLSSAEAELAKPLSRQALDEVRALRRQLEQELAALSERLGADEQRLDQALQALADTRRRIEQSLAEGGDALNQATADLLARMRAELEALKAELDRQRQAGQALGQRLDELAAQAGERLEQARGEAARLAQELADRAQGFDMALAQERLRAAVDTGRAYADELARIAAEAAVEIPRALRDSAETGVTPMIELRAAFPPAARRALKAAIRAQAGDGLGERIAAFFRAQIGARSLEEREGDDPDAILSRAEGALKRGDLKTAVELVRTLPPPAVAEMQDWLDKAERRLAVEEALDQLPGARPAER